MRLLSCPFPRVNWFSVCDVSYGQVFTVGICITKAYEAVRCAEMYAVRGCECQMNNAQPKVVALEPQ